MIIRRFITALRQQDWTTVTIEFLIVVAGIFVGLQVDDWNRSVNDRALERGYLERLHADISRLLPMQQRILTRRTETLGQLSNIADAFFIKSSIESLTDAHCQALTRSHIYSPLTTAMPAMNEMLGTGALGLIKDVRLRDELSSLQIQIARSEELVARLGRRATILPRKYPAAIWEVPTRNGEEDLHDERAGCDFGALVNNRGFSNDFSDNYSRYQSYLSTGLRDTNERFKTVHKLLEEVLQLTLTNE
jgi:hypothetical protein